MRRRAFLGSERRVLQIKVNPKMRNFEGEGYNKPDLQKQKFSQTVQAVYFSTG